MQFDYFYGNEAEQFTFYRIPKVLVTSPQFKRVSDGAKLLYGLMLDRMGLSLKNGWVDAENRAYIFFTTKDVMEQMCCGTEKATKIPAELDSEKGIGLIERKKQGQGKPAIVYLKKFIISEQQSRLSETENQDFGKSKSQTFDNRNSRLSETESADFRQSKCNDNKYNDGTFGPEEQITRAEFVTMCARFYNLFDKTTDGRSNKFTDVESSHWAYSFINSATAMDWINGYSDGSFRPDNNITRAEVVAIVNRVTDREADTEYVNKNISAVNKFTDLKDKSYWAFYDIIEAANTHMSIESADDETWVK